VRFSITVRMNPYLQQAIDAIPADAWTPMPDWEPRGGQAEVAETRIPAFKGNCVPVRLIVRRVTPKTAKAGEQLTLLPDWRYHALVTDIAGSILQAEAFHRDHAGVENTVKDLKGHAGLAHLPSGRFAANAPGWPWSSWRTTSAGGRCWPARASTASRPRKRCGRR
jgi:hypothetical protein